MTKWHGGKGSNPRPTDKQKFDEGWDRIFGNKSSINDVDRNGKKDKKDLPTDNKDGKIN